VKPQFQADADLNEDIVTGVLRREPGIDFQTATEAKLRNLADIEVLQLASGENRILVTHDRKTMPRAFGQFIQTRRSPACLSFPSAQMCLLSSNGCYSYGRPLKLKNG
jgi:hypothetical protein